MAFRVIESEEISNRTDFSLLCNERGYLDAVEVGTDQAVFATDFLRRFLGNWLICVDPYEPHPDFPFDRSGDFAVAVNALAPFHGRFRLIKSRSPEAAGWVKTFVRPDFVYIDGSHEEKDVAADLVGWWDVLADDGMLAGHDFDDIPIHRGVRQAVERFARLRGLVVRLTHERHSPPSWYIYKNEPERLHRRFFDAGEMANPFFAGGSVAARPPLGSRGS